MKVKSVSYSITFELPPEFGIERWRKIGLEIEPEKAEVVEQVLDGVDKQIKTWHEAKFPELYGKAKPKNPLPVINTSADYSNEDEEWNKVKEALNAFKFREDAQAYLDLTPFKLTLEAKKIVSQKPIKK
jgi:hypothetical protein